MMALACMALAPVGAVHASAPVTTPVLGKTQLFKDWAVGCDNGLACQAVALDPEGSGDRGISVMIARGSGVAAPLAFRIAGEQAKSGNYILRIDGRTAGRGTIAADSDFLSLSGADALRLARAMARGQSLEVIAADGNSIGRASLSGVSAALRYIDAQQGRAGSSGAIVATGKRKAVARTIALPIITAVRIAPSSLLPDASSLVALSENSPCASDRAGTTEDTAFSLGSGSKGAQALVLLNCGSGAYNFSSAVYIGQRDSADKWTFAPARFDYGASGFDGQSKLPIVINADWDVARQTLTSFSKARGLGDCGSSESWVWDGAMFRLTAATIMGECRGATDWIPVWRAEVRFLP
jgi:hypothetical protein